MDIPNGVGENEKKNPNSIWELCICVLPPLLTDTTYFIVALVAQTLFKFMGNAQRKTG